MIYGRVHRVYVEKKPEFAVQARFLEEELRTLLNLTGLKKFRVLQRYDVSFAQAEDCVGGPDEETLFRYAVNTVLSEAPLDIIHYELPGADYICAVEYLPGQFDQRSDSAARCIELITQNDGGETGRPMVANAVLYLLYGNFSESDKEKTGKYLINPVEARQASLAPKGSLDFDAPVPGPVRVLEKFNRLSESGLEAFAEEYSLAMDKGDLLFIQDYFRKEGRPPSITEIKVLDTYWSDHCRHTTFNTALKDIRIEESCPYIRKSYGRYLEIKKELGRGGEPDTLMDITTIAARYLCALGKLPEWDVSDEVNACTIKVPVEITAAGKREISDYYILFKNETHNHPTEIEPFGGAATCIGGAIRDPLSGRAFVYQAMRVTGGGDPFTPVDATLKGKLPQRKIISGAAQGYSSYGNQIGLATGLVQEFYHPGYTAKRMEIGAVIGAVPCRKVRREKPVPGDLVILTGGRTGRDGCGGATGSSKAHKEKSLRSAGAEVQKGNAPEERKLQRLFRNGEASLLIKKCNDFGAGGVSVAIGELACGLKIDLDAVPKKYLGLDGTELAISESQERMAVVVAPEDAERFISLAKSENLEAVVTARVSASPRLVMYWQGQKIVDISREFLNTNGKQRSAQVTCTLPAQSAPEAALPAPAAQSGHDCVGTLSKFIALAEDLNVCCKKGLAERFDSSIGAATVFAPYGGKYQLTEQQVMCAKVPVFDECAVDTAGVANTAGIAETAVCTVMSFGFDPFLSEANPYKGAYLSVLSSVGKLAAAGTGRHGIYLSLQEYFPRPDNAPERWGLPFAALLGAMQAQLDLGIAAIGGKDSMSGSFESLDVPPSLVSFALGLGDSGRLISAEFKKAGNGVYLIQAAPADGEGEDGLPDAESFLRALDFLETNIREGNIVSAWCTGRHGAAEAIMKMCFGNRLGVRFESGVAASSLFSTGSLAFVCEFQTAARPEENGFSAGKLGSVQEKYSLDFAGEEISLQTVEAAWKNRYEPFMPFQEKGDRKEEPEPAGTPGKSGSAKPVPRSPAAAHRTGISRPAALIPIFPGTNCEFDTERALRRAGAKVEFCVLNNLSSAGINESTKLLAGKLKRCNMFVLPGGFSGADEPDGSAKLICAFLRRECVRDALTDLIENRDGLVLGICNGFQALIKLGLLPFGKILEPDENFPTLTFNKIGRHQSLFVRTKIVSKLSPWLLCEELGAVRVMPVSHGEGRFAASAALIAELRENGQIAAQYTDPDGNPSMELPHNPNGSAGATECITSADGRILGKMGHCERWENGLYKNIPGEKHLKLFESGVKYFTG